MDSSISNDTGDSNSEGAQTEICASLDAFSINGTPPQEGDDVKFEVEGTVSRIDGDNAYVTPKTVNGQPVMDDQGGDNEPDGDALRQNAQNLDRQQYAAGGVAGRDATVDVDNRGAVLPPKVTPRLKKTVKNFHYNPYGGGPRREGDRFGG